MDMLCLCFDMDFIYKCQLGCHFEEISSLKFWLRSSYKSPVWVGSAAESVWQRSSNFTSKTLLTVFSSREITHATWSRQLRYLIEVEWVWLTLGLWLADVLRRPGNIPTNGGCSAPLLWRCPASTLPVNCDCIHIYTSTSQSEWSYFFRDPHFYLSCHDFKFLSFISFAGYRGRGRGEIFCWPSKSYWCSQCCLWTFLLPFY